MMFNNIDRFLFRSLLREKRTKLGIIEKIIMERTGKSDAAHGLPQIGDDGRWSSPAILKEISSCNETHNKIYGVLQLCLEDKYKRAAALADILRRSKIRIDELNSKFPVPLSESDCSIRRSGEEQLTEFQVRRRRIGEYNRAVKAVQDQIDSIKEKDEENFNELVDLNNYLIQKNYEAEIVCERIRCHVQQRIDCYWSAAVYASYGNKRSIPSSYMSLPIPDVVESYKRLHEEDNRKIAEIVAFYSADVNKEAA